MASTTGAALSMMLKDVLIRLGLPISNLRSQTYDGASNMSGKYKGCQAEIKKEQPLAMYVHCGAHVTHLVTSKAVQMSQVVRNSLDSVQQLGVLYKESGKFKQLYLDLDVDDVSHVTQISNSTKTIKPIFPTRWLTRAAAVVSVLNNYKNVLNALSIASEEFGTNTATRANGLKTSLSPSDTLLGLCICIPILNIL